MNKKIFFFLLLSTLINKNTIYCPTDFSTFASLATIAALVDHKDNDEKIDDGGEDINKKAQKFIPKKIKSSKKKLSNNNQKQNKQNIKKDRNKFANNDRQK